jgi:DNA polymerase-3 subunit beta
MTEAIASRILTVDAAPFARALKDAKRVIEKRNSIPILAHALIDAGRMIVTDLDILLTLDLPGAVQSPDMPFTVPVDAILKAMTGATCAQVHADMHVCPTADAPGMVRWIIGDMAIDLDTLPPEDFPYMAKGTYARELETVATFKALHLRDVLRLCASSISDEATRYYLNGINLCGEGDRASPTFTAVATNGHHLTHVSVPAAKWAGDAMILPRKSADVLAAMLTNPVAQVELCANYQTLLQVNGPGWTLRTKVIDGTFPDYTRIMPRTDTLIGATTLDCTDVKAKAKRLKALSEARSCGVEVDTVKGTLTTTGIDIKRTQIKIASAFAGMPEFCPTFGINAQYLADSMDTVLMVCPSAVVASAGKGDPMRITPATQPDWAAVTVVCMPMRV